MAEKRKHVVILPHFCEEEVDRYLQIATLLKSWPKPQVDVDFLLAASPKRQPSQRLADAYGKLGLGKVTLFQCPTQIFGYPEGPGAMFWDCMEYIEQHYGGNDGFSLWLESDMCPTQTNWIDHLSDTWHAGDQRPIIMGCYVPEVYKYRAFRKPKLILDPHVNGGACYAMNFASQMPPEARQGVFDMAVYRFAAEQGRARECRAISFSTNERVRRDLLDPNKVLLHGFMQDKDSFIEACTTPVSERERKKARWAALQNQLEGTRRKFRTLKVRRGKQAMLENMFLAKQRHEAQHPQPAPAITVTRKAA